MVKINDFENPDICSDGVGVGEIEAVEVIIYPNPASDVLTINTGNLKNAQVELFDIAGRTLFHQKLTSSSSNIDVSDLANGIYICAVISGNQVVKREKILKQ